MSQIKGIVPTSEMDAIPNLKASNIGNKIVHKNDLVFNKLKSHLGVFSVSQYEGIVSPDYSVYFAANQVDAKYLEFLFKTDLYITEFNKRSSGVGQGLTRLYTKDLFDIFCILPEKKERQRIVSSLQELVKSSDSIITKKQEQLSVLADYKKSLIYEYVTGKKEVPAS